ncbi:MAG TPA: ImmA/IrrE family metallo-endopeptidase [Bacillus bacterium]|nr:ImmA/IrrE family metallo-endopeptidase [Bacillus sp. (in: firmicutes)]
MLYKPTRLEHYVSTIFKNLHIYQPYEIDKIYIADKLEIKLEYSRHKPFAYEEDDFKFINIDKYETKKGQREQFYHELCHILRHAGDQLKMPKPFTDRQEWDAKNFMLNAAIPYHMIHLINDDEYVNIKHLSDTFLVTENLIVERLKQINRRREMYLLESRYLQTCIY